MHIHTKQLITGHLIIISAVGILFFGAGWMQTSLIEEKNPVELLNEPLEQNITFGSEAGWEVRDCSTTARIPAYHMSKYTCVTKLFSYPTKKNSTYTLTFSAKAALSDTIPIMEFVHNNGTTKRESILLHDFPISASWKSVSFDLTTLMEDASNPPLKFTMQIPEHMHVSLDNLRLTETTTTQKEQNTNTNEMQANSNTINSNANTAQDTQNTPNNSANNNGQSNKNVNESMVNANNNSGTGITLNNNTNTISLQTNTNFESSENTNAHTDMTSNANNTNTNILIINLNQNTEQINSNSTTHTASTSNTNAANQSVNISRGSGATNNPSSGMYIPHVCRYHERLYRPYSET